MNKEEALKKIFNKIANRDLDEIFVVDLKSGRKIKVGEFYNDVLAVSKIIEEKEFKQFLALVLNNSYELLLLYFACLITNRVAVPIDPKLGEARIRETISEFDEIEVICDEDWSINNVVNTECIFDNLKVDNIESIEFLNRLKKCNFDNLYLITFTSGTSGKLKGVKNSFANLLLCADAFVELHSIKENQVFMHNMVMTYMAGIFNTIFIPFVSGSKIVLSERFSVKVAVDFWELVRNNSVDTFWMSPTMLSILLKMDRGYSGVNYCEKTKTNWYVGTAPLSNKLKLEFEQKYSVKLFQSYGLSETLIISSVETSTHCEYVNPGVGRVLRDVEVEIDETGELLLTTPWMFLGYTNTNTEQYFSNDKYLSGDIGYFRNQVLYITDRKKDLIIRGGINVSPKYIENEIEKVEYVSEVAIVAISDENMGEKIGCAVVLCDDIAFDLIKKCIISKVKKLGYGYAVDKFVVVSELPKNLNGKIDKTKIKELF